MNGSALGWASEVQEIQRFVRHSGGLPKIGNPKNSFSFRVTSEDWKSKEFVRHWGSVDFRVLKNNEKSRFVSGVLGFVRFLDVRYIGLAFGSWVLNIWISVHGFWIYGFDFRFLGFGYIDRVSTSNFWLGSSSFPLTNWGFPLQTLLDGRVFPSDFIRSGFLRTFIRLGEDDE
ncbi:unnamed protein product [Rhizophagus irregularis]|nr:unnamed protein product [Rhizophagus irregularis]